MVEERRKRLPVLAMWAGIALWGCGSGGGASGVGDIGGGDREVGGRDLSGSEIVDNQELDVEWLEVGLLDVDLLDSDVLDREEWDTGPWDVDLQDVEILDTADWGTGELDSWSWDGDGLDGDGLDAGEWDEWAAEDTGADVCVASCDGKQCGDDGCGGSCGGCLEYEEECSGGQCVALPDLGVDLGAGVTSWPTKLQAGGKIVIRYTGFLKSNNNLNIHYGYNGWNYQSGESFSDEDDGSTNMNYFVQTPMVQLPGGVGWEVTLDLPVEARAIHFVFFTNENGGKVWDNNGYRDWGRGVVFPLVGPYLMWNSAVEEGSSGVVVSFVTGHSCRGVVEYGLTPGLGALQEEEQDAVVHRLLLEELEVGVGMYYRVRCGASVSPVYEMSGVGSGCVGGSNEFSFLVFGDAQETGEHGRWSATAATMLEEHWDVDFLVCVGDMTWNDRPGLWWTYFDSARELLASKVVMPVPGNHDTPGSGSDSDTTSFEEYFGLEFSSGSSTYYSYEYCGSRFIAMNSEWPDGFAKVFGQQYQWLGSVLDSNTEATWSFAYWHIPPYNAGGRHYGSQGPFRDMTELFDGRVDWFFGGHEHLYQRMKPMGYNAQILTGGYGTGVGDGVGYVVVPPAGAWSEGKLVSLSDPKAYYRDRLAYPVPPESGDAVPSERGFLRVDIGGNGMVMTVYGLGTALAPVASHVVDVVQYSKP